MTSLRRFGGNTTQFPVTLQPPTFVPPVQYPVMAPMPMPPPPNMSSGGSLPNFAEGMFPVQASSNLYILTPLHFIYIAFVLPPQPLLFSIFSPLQHLLPNPPSCSLLRRISGDIQCSDCPKKGNKECHFKRCRTCCLRKMKELGYRFVKKKKKRKGGRERSGVGAGGEQERREERRWRV